MKKLNTQEFVTRASIIHKNLYDYSKVEYKNSRSKILIRCIFHDYWFEQLSASHLNGNGCPKCSNNIKMDTISFINKSIAKHGDLYDYSLSNYTISTEKVKIRCIKHNIIFEQVASMHINGQGCPRCGGTGKLTNELFINNSMLIHGLKYDYSLVNYCNVNIKVKIRCIKHDIVFEQIARDHLAGHGCPICPHTSSNKEQKWLNSLNIDNLNRQKSIKINGKWYKVDGFDPATNTIYEFYGDFWHGNPKIFNPDDLNHVRKITFGELYKNTIRKELELKSLGFSIITMWENDFAE